MSRKAETVQEKRNTDPQISPISQICAYFAFWPSLSQNKKLIDYPLSEASAFRWNAFLLTGGQLYLAASGLMLPGASATRFAHKLTKKQTRLQASHS